VRKTLTYHVPNPDKFTQQLLVWLGQWDHACMLDDNGSANGWKSGFIAAAGSLRVVETLSDIASKGDWLFGHLSYDLKNSIEDLVSENPGSTGFSITCFFQPVYVLTFHSNELQVHYHASVTEEAAKGIIDEILGVTIPEPASIPQALRPRISKEEYLEHVSDLKRHISLGDIYEVNFCQELYSEDAVIDPGDIYSRLNAISRAPFAAFYKQEDKYLMCASPERFISKQGSTIVSQPIKGTARRGADAEEDERLKNELYLDEKERSENVMIVDLVRNDLSRIAKRGSVKVDELFGIYTFQQVHQMISTVSAEVKEDVIFEDIIRAAFPMGSMTGAPKIRAMQLIEEHESMRRGLYSGSVGYIDPSGNFDFNVVIRSILYNSASRYLSFMVGSAITDGSVPEKEYEECMIKAAAMLRVLGGKVHSS
jgi:para-aminobenzoate synthetase component 1